MSPSSPWIANPKRALLVAGLLILLAGAFGLAGVESLRGGESDFNDSGTQSQVARAKLMDLTGVDSEQGFVAVIRLGTGAPAARPPIVRAVRARLRGLDGVRALEDFWSTGDRAMLSHDGRSAYVAAAMEDVSRDELPLTKEAKRQLSATPALARRVTVGGETAIDAEVNEKVANDLGAAQRLVFPFLLIGLILVFRGFRVALIPLGCALATLLLSLAFLHLFTFFVPVSVYSLNLVSALAVGLSIDYGLLILSRHREELGAPGAGVQGALIRAMGSAGRTVAMSAVTLSVALCALFVFPQRFLYSMALGGIVATLMAMVVARTVLPALLILLGERAAPSRRGRGGADAAWRRWARYVTRFPLRFALLGTALLLLAGAPFLQARFVGIDASVLPGGASARVASEDLASEFSAGSVGPVRFVLEASSPAAVRAYAAEVARTPGIAAVARPVPLVPGTWALEASTTAAPLSSAGRRAVEAAREIEVPGVEADVGGTTANFLDLQSSIVAHIPPALAVLAVAMILILFAVTASVVIPIKTVLLNLLTVSAVFGLLVWIFQDGRLTGVLDYGSQGGIETTTPILLFAITFGLATDYAVFVISRIREAHEAGASNRESVVIGVERTGRVVTAAALLFSIPAGALVTSSIVFLKELAVGVVAGVLIDAFIVRTLVVPSLMVLLGEWNWWCPAVLRSAHRRLGLQRMIEIDRVDLPPALQGQLTSQEER